MSEFALVYAGSQAEMARGCYGRNSAELRLREIDKSISHA